MLDIRQNALTKAAQKLRMMAKHETNKQTSLTKWALEYLSHHLTKPMSRLHITQAEEYDSMRHDRGRKELIIAPRGNAKTTWSIANVLKAVCEETERYILLISDTGPIAQKMLEIIKLELEHNEKLKKDYPLACTQGAVWNKDRIETANGVCIEALGTGQQVRGKRYKQYRPSLIVVDDPDNDAEVKRPTTRQNHIEWFDRALSSCGDSNTNIVVIGTMLHRECIVGHLEKRPDFKVVKFQSIMAWPKRMDMWGHWEQLYWSQPIKFVNGLKEVRTGDADEYYETNRTLMDEGADVLWPAVEDLYTLMKERAARGHAAFASEKQNEPRDPSKCEFAEEWFEDTDYDYQEFLDRCQKERKITAIYADPSMGGDKKRDVYSPIILLHFFGDPWFYVEVQMTKIPVTTLTDNCLDFYKQTDAQILGFESNGFQRLIGDELFSKARARGMFNVHVQPVDHHGVHKLTRISRLSVWLQRKAFRFKKGCPHTRLLLQQLQDHPNAQHDDGSDALEGCLTILSEITSGVSDFEEDDGIGSRIA